MILWISLLLVGGLSGHALCQHLETCWQHAAVEQGIIGQFAQRLLSYALNDLARMGQGLADQLQVARVELHGLERAQRFVVQHVQVAEDATASGVAPPAHQAEPAREPQHRQGACDGFVGRFRHAGHRGQPWAQLLVGRPRSQAVVVEHQATHLPGVALQWREPSIEEQGSRHRLVAIATEQKAVLGAAVAGARSFQALQGAVEDGR